MSGFVEVQFPPSIALGATGGATFSTDIVTTFSGYEQRSINWDKARGRWNIATGIKSKADIDALIAFFRARRGRAIGFRFKDWSDYSATAAVIGTGDAATTTFQLKKQYSSGAVSVDRTINKPVSGTLTIYENAVEKTSGVSLDTTTGIVTLTPAPGSGVTITADFEFDVPVRFDTDQMDTVMDTDVLGNWSSIPLIEIRV